MTARVALFDGPGSPFRILNVPLPQPGPGECVVRVSLATICGSDLHTIHGNREGVLPCVLGHEAVGIVESVGDGVTTIDGFPLAFGDRVVWSVAASCGRCFFCVRGLPQKCAALRKYGKELPDPARGPSGCFASHVHLWPGTAICRVPAEVPDSVIAPAMCATATIAAVLSAGEPLVAGDSVLITGAGMLGLTAAAMCHPKSVVIVDRDNRQLGRAAHFGDPKTILFPDESSELSKCAQNTAADRGGFDLALELTGANAMAELCLEHTRVGGTVVLAGAVYPTGTLRVDHERIVRKCLTVRGVHNYAPSDLLDAVNFLALHHNRFPFADLVSPPFSLDRIDEAIQSKVAVRTSIKP